MFKKMIVSVLVITVVVAVGASIYNARAASPVETQVKAPAAASVLAHPAAVDTSMADAAQEAPLAAAIDTVSTYQSQSFGSGAGSAAGYGSGQPGGGRRAGQSGQNSANAGTYDAIAGSSATGGMGQGGGGQGASGASGRPAWAGSNGSSQGAGGRP